MYFSPCRSAGYMILLWFCACCLIFENVKARSRRQIDPEKESDTYPDYGYPDYEIYQIPEFEDSTFYDSNETYWNITTYPPYEAANPGFRARVTQKALDYATTLAVDILMSQIEFLNIPDIQQTIGNIDVKVHRVRIVRFDRPKAQFIPHPGSGISLKISGLNVKVLAIYEAEMGLGFFGTINKEGTLSVRTKNLSLSVKLQIDKHPWTGLPSKLRPICTSSGDLIITFKGGWSDMLNVGSSVFATTIRSLIASQVCSAAQTEIDKNVNTEDGLLLFNQTIMGLFDFHFTMTDFPVFTEHFVESSHMGTTYYIPQWQEPPFIPAPIPPFEEHMERMFYVYVSDYVLNSAFHAGFLSGLLDYNVTTDLVSTLPLPPQFREILSTSCESPRMCLGILYPGLAKHFPGGQVKINVYATEAPNVTFYDGHSVRVKVGGNLEFFVESYGQVYPAFGLSFSISVDVSLVVQDKRITFRLNDLSPSVNILYSNVDDVGTSFFYETIIRTGIRVALPFIEDFGEKGLDIPELLNLKIENSEIIVIEEQGVFVVATDVRIIIPKGINFIAMLGPQNDTDSNTTAAMDIEEATTELPLTTSTLARRPARVGPPRPKAKSKRRRNRNGRRRRTTTTTAGPTEMSLNQAEESMAEPVEQTTGVSEVSTEREMVRSVPKRPKTTRRRKRPRSKKVESPPE